MEHQDTPNSNQLTEKDNEKSFSIKNELSYFEVFKSENNFTINSKIIDLLNNLNLKDTDNTEKVVLDFGGGQGFYGLFIREFLNAKKSICIEPDTKLIDSGKIKFSEQFKNGSIEYFPLMMEEALDKLNKSQLYQKNNLSHNKTDICAIVIKESIHFTSAEFFKKLIDYCSVNMKNGVVIIIGFASYKNWAKEPQIPITALERLKKEYFNITSCYNILVALSEDNKNKNNKENFSFTFENKDVEYDLSIEQFESFILNKAWSSFRDIPNEELENTVIKYKKLAESNNEKSIKLVITYSFLTIQFNQERLNLLK